MVDQSPHMMKLRPCDGYYKHATWQNAESPGLPVSGYAKGIILIIASRVGRSSRCGWLGLQTKRRGMEKSRGMYSALPIDAMRLPLLWLPHHS